MKNNNVVIIGHFGGNTNVLDGQTIKTKILYEELKNKTNWSINIIDTYYKKKKPISLFFKSIKSFFTAKDVLVLLSGNGMKFYFPILFFFSRFLGLHVYHDVIGGNLASYVEQNPIFKRYLNSFEVNWVESKNLEKQLVEMGIVNCEVIPNFKRLNLANVKYEHFEEPYRFCTFSRVMKEKGIEEAFDAIKCINSKKNRVYCKLDIFGPITDDYKEKFSKLMKNASPDIEYKGVVPYDESVHAISSYYSLLFPTFWEGEGFPGTIIDAFSAGLPVIASDWNCNREVIENEVNGLLYPSDKASSLIDAIEWMTSTDINVLKKNCVERARKYQPDNYIDKIIKTIECEK